MMDWMDAAPLAPMPDYKLRQHKRKLMLSAESIPLPPGYTVHLKKSDLIEKVDYVDGHWVCECCGVNNPHLAVMCHTCGVDKGEKIADCFRADTSWVKFGFGLEDPNHATVNERSSSNNGTYRDPVEDVRRSRRPPNPGMAKRQISQPGATPNDPKKQRSHIRFD
jgi:hypothetical protein